MARKNWDVVPSVIFNTSMATASYDYYINEQVPYDIYISKIRVMFQTVGTDNSRFAIYRGNDLTAVLSCANSYITGSIYNITIYNT